MDHRGDDPRGSFRRSVRRRFQLTTPSTIHAPERTVAELRP
jgi:hypothetical protein